MHIARRECWRLKSYFLKPTIFWTFWTRCTRGFWLLLAVLFLHLANALTSTVPMQALGASAPAALPAQGTSCQAGTQAPAWEWDHDYFSACAPCFCFKAFQRIWSLHSFLCFIRNTAAVLHGPAGTGDTKVQPGGRWMKSRSFAWWRNKQGTKIPVFQLKVLKKIFKKKKKGNPGVTIAR